jgi:hypothetical protein
MTVANQRLPTERSAKAAWLLVGLGLLGAALLARAQISVRPAEPLGLSIREARVRVIHSTQPDVPGTSMHLQQSDPWLAYQRGRSYFFHEWGKNDGVFAALQARELAGATTSCGMCHNLPFRTPGAGGNAVQPIGHGLNTPHLFGAGLIEMIGMQIRAQILDAYDDNHDGFLEVPAETAHRRAVVEAAPGVLIDFGPLDDPDGRGMPGLNPALKVRLVDAQGRPRPRRPDGTPSRLGDPGIAGYDLSTGVFGSSAGDHQFATLRVFIGGVLRTVMGMVADDPTTFQPLGKLPERQREQRWAMTSNAGAPQPNLELQPAARQALETLAGQHAGTLSEGEIDLLEWFLLNQPAPAEARQDEATHHGRQLLTSFACTSCHVADWVLKPEDPRHGFAGDRRFFDLEVAPNAATGELQGRLRPLTTAVQGASGQTLAVPRRGGFVVRGIWSDFRHHDLGERFAEVYVDRRGQARTLRSFRTPPLWGVGSTAPYGHDGGSMTLDDVIRRHGGEAAAAALAYAAASAADREALIAFLRTLVLYQPDQLPTDLAGDGRIAEDFMVGGHATGPERFRPELLFRVPAIYRGWTVGPDGDRYFSYTIENREEAYGENLLALADRDHDGIPDCQEHAGGCGTPPSATTAPIAPAATSAPIAPTAPAAKHRDRR